MMYNEAGLPTVTLTKPLKSTNGKEVFEIALNEPTGGSLEDIAILLQKVKAKRGGLSPYSPLFAAIAVTATPRITYDEARKLDLADLVEVAEVLESFRGYKILDKQAK